jgi:prepilin-type processing-associated H-X9-DG protein
VVQPEKKCLLADCVTAYGFDMETIAYLRYSNYDPSLRQNGWLLDQFTGAGRVAWPDRLVEGLTRHQFGSNIAFADGHVRWLRHDRIPNNDERDGKQYRALVLAMAPWK